MRALRLSMLSRCLTVAGLVSTAATAAAAPPTTLYWDMNASAATGALSYAEQVVAVTLQGIANRGGPVVFLAEGFLDFDWSNAEPWWRSELEAAGRAVFVDVQTTTSTHHRDSGTTNGNASGLISSSSSSSSSSSTVSSTSDGLCALVNATAAAGVTVAGTVLYDSAASDGDGYMLALALTLSGQLDLLPVTPELRARHACLGALPVVQNFSVGAQPEFATRQSAWAWAVRELLPGANKSVVFNLYHYDAASAATDPQSNATVGNLDYAIQNRAFITGACVSAA
jgi:hypothetical protein